MESESGRLGTTNHHPLDGNPDEEVREAIRDALAELVENYELATVISSLHKVYDEYDRGKMSARISEFNEAEA